MGSKSETLYIDSTFRDRTVWPSPTEFDIPWSQIEKSFNQVHTKQSRCYVGSIDFFTAPSIAAITSSATLFVSITSKNENKKSLIVTNHTSNNVARANFVFPVIDEAVGGSPFIVMTKEAVHMKNTFKFKLDDDLHFAVFDMAGALLPIVDVAPPGAPDPALQIRVKFTFTRCDQRLR